MYFIKNQLTRIIVCDRLAKRNPDKMSFPDCTTNKMTMRDVAPLSIVFVSMMTLNNLCLQEVILKINDAKKELKI